MRVHEVPDFDEWVREVFAPREPEPEPIDPSDWRAWIPQEPRSRIVSLPPPIVTDYLTRLGHEPGFIAKQYRDEQIASAVWFLFGTDSSYWHAVRDATVAESRQIACLRALGRLYTELFDQVCCNRGRDVKGRYYDATKLDSAVYMIWDMDCLESCCMDDGFACLADAGFDVLETALYRCRTTTCQISALHGLGHIALSHPQRVRKLVMPFIRQKRAPAWLRAYAECACAGNVP